VRRSTILHKPDNDYVFEYFRSMGGRPRAPRERRALQAILAGRALVGVHLQHIV
jgi:hypothetical protein